MQGSPNAVAKHQTTWVEKAGTALQVLLWSATFLAGVAWLVAYPLPFEAEPITVLLGLVSVAVSALVGSYGQTIRARRAEFEAERFTMPDALAYGYVTNFVEPAVTRLLRATEPGEDPPRLFIYMPREISELDPQSIERILARIRGRRFSTGAVTLDFVEGRARDVLTIMRSGEKRPWYFDFPNTLRTLAALVEFKLPSHADSFNETDRKALSREYIERFDAEVRRLLAAKGLAENVEMTDADLGFLRAKGTA